MSGTISVRVYRLQELHSSCNKLLSCLCAVLAKMREESDSSVTFIEEILTASLPTLHCMLLQKLILLCPCSINITFCINSIFCC